MKEKIVTAEDAEQLVVEKNSTLYYTPTGHAYLDKSVAVYETTTHTQCQTNGCGCLARKPYIYCEPCRTRIQIERYNSFPIEDYDSSSPLYSESAERYFNSLDDVYEYIEECDHETSIEDLRLLKTKPLLFNMVDDDKLYDTSVDFEVELPENIQAKLDSLNDEIAKYHEGYGYTCVNIRLNLHD